MLKPERMSKISITGSKAVMEATIETIHDLTLVHLEGYDDSWEDFRRGDPIEGSEDLSETLVTVRSIESILDIDETDAGPPLTVSEQTMAERTEECRQRVNELDDERSDLEEQRRAIEEELSQIRPLATLGIDLDLLCGYETIDVAVVRGRRDQIESALSADDEIDAYEIFSAENIVAIFAAPSGETVDGIITDALVGVDIEELEVPEASGSPGDHQSTLEHRKQQLDVKIDRVERDMEDLKLEVAGFLLAADEELSIEVQKKEAPLRFATTARSFIAEGWVPTNRFDDLEGALAEHVGDRVELEELETVEYADAAPRHGHGGSENHAETDGGTVTSMHSREPPVVLQNSTAAKPFQLLVETISRPRYYEIDPTIILLLTFPTMFGVMIGDVGYGILYILMGLGLYRMYESPGMRSLGGIAIWCGIFTTIFGFFYGELFGFHTFDYYFWQPIVGLEGPPIEKGLDSAFALFWLVVALLIGLVHLSIGYVFGFLNELKTYDFKTAASANLSWLLLMNGFWVWVLSHHGAHLKPDFVYTVFDGEPVALGFSGFDPTIGVGGLAVAAVGFLLMLYGEFLHEGGLGIAIGLLESLSGMLVNVLSYARVTAVLLAKAGMAFVVNLLTVGAYRGPDGRLHFLDPATSTAPPDGDLMFGGVMTTDAGIAVVLLTLLVGALIFIIGHIIVLFLGISSAGLQGVRLEYVEFFGKFYDGGGDKYEPFGYDRSYTNG